MQSAKSTVKSQALLAPRNLADLQGVVKFLKSKEMLATIKSEVNLKHEMAGVASQFDGGKAVLFESLSHDSNAPLFAGLYWNRAILAAVFDTEEANLPFFMADSVANWQENPVDPIIVEEGPANEVFLDPSEDMLKQIPIPTLALKDGGAYLDSCVLIAKDPETGVRNASIQRLMVAGPNRLTMQLDMGRHLRDYYERAEKMGVPLEVTINNGVGPAVHFAAVTPSNTASLDQDELGVASELLGEPLRLLRSQEVKVEGIADAQYIIEGEILPYTRETEGPFGEVTGYYAEQDNRWVIKVKAVTRRENPIFHAIMPGREVYNAVGLMAESSIFHHVSSRVPDLKGVFLTYGGCGFYHAVIQVEKSQEGVQNEAVEATFEAFPPLRRVTVVDDDVNMYDPLDVEWAMATRHDPEKGVILIPNMRGHELNPMTINGVGTKVGIDATAPFPRPNKFQRVTLQDVNLEDYEIDYKLR